MDLIFIAKTLQVEAFPCRPGDSVYSPVGRDEILSNVRYAQGHVRRLEMIFFSDVVCKARL